MLALRLGQFAELCAERSRKTLFEAPYDVLERKDGRDRRAHHFLRLRQKRKEARYRAIEGRHGALGGSEDGRSCGCALRQKQRRSPPFFSQKLGGFPDECVTGKAAFQFLDALALIVGQGEHGEECARFDEEQGRGDQNELCGLAERKFGKFFDVREICVGHFRERYFRYGKFALLNEVEERFKRAGVCFCL